MIAFFLCFALLFGIFLCLKGEIWLKNKVEIRLFWGLKNGLVELLVELIVLEGKITQSD